MKAKMVKGRVCHVETDGNLKPLNFHTCKSGKFGIPIGSDVYAIGLFDLHSNESNYYDAPDTCLFVGMANLFTGVKPSYYPYLSIKAKNTVIHGEKDGPGISVLDVDCKEIYVQGCPVDTLLVSDSANIVNLESVGEEVCPIKNVFVRNPNTTVIIEGFDLLKSKMEVHVPPNAQRIYFKKCKNAYSRSIIYPYSVDPTESLMVFSAEKVLSGMSEQQFQEYKSKLNPSIVRFIEGNFVVCVKCKTMNYITKCRFNPRIEWCSKECFRSPIDTSVSICNRCDTYH